MKKSAFVIASILAGSAIAAEPNYNFVQGSLVKAEEIEILGVDIALEGYGFDFSHELTDQLFGFANYTTLDDKIGSYTIDIEQLQAGVGFRMPIAQSTDFFTSAALIKVESDGPGEDYSDDGYVLAAGIRSMVTDSIELSASYTHEDLDESDNYVTVSGQYFFNKNVSVGVSHVDKDDADLNSLFVRYSF